MPQSVLTLLPPVLPSSAEACKLATLKVALESPSATYRHSLALTFLLARCIVVGCHLTDLLLRTSAVPFEVVATESSAKLSESVRVASG